METLFCWHGFIYVRVTSTGFTGFKGTLDSIVGLEIHTNVTQTGYLEFGGGSPKAAAAADVLNGVNQMTLQSQRTNIAAYMPTGALQLKLGMIAARDFDGVHGCCCGCKQIVRLGRNTAGW